VNLGDLRVTSTPYRAGVGIVEEASAYLAGDGRRYARSCVRKNRLPVHLTEDLVQETLLALHRAELRGREIDNVEAYAVRTMHHIAVDLVRGRVRRREAEVVPLIVDDGPEPPIPDDGAFDLGVVAALALADARRTVARLLHRRPRAASGALAVLAHADPSDPADPADDCPKPAGGATPGQAAAWVGLFYAGLRDCWSDDGDTDAGRKRRSRSAADQRAVLDEALAAAGLIPGGAGG
jgi:DNA-directed RNA polymerase specialized sigma24 family protein